MIDRTDRTCEEAARAFRWAWRCMALAGYCDQEDGAQFQRAFSAYTKGGSADGAGVWLSGWLARDNEPPHRPEVRDPLLLRLIKAARGGK